MTDQTPDDPRDVDDAELAEQPAPPLPDLPSAPPVVEDEYVGSGENAPGGAEREAPAGEDYAGSGF